MKIFFVTYLICGVLGSLVLLVTHSSLAALSFAAGCAFMMLDVAAMYFAWSRVLAKRVALPVGVIVIKYAILGFILYRVASENLLNVPVFAAGISVVLVSSVVSVLRAPKV